MTECNIWEIPLPEVTLQDLFRTEGADYSKRPPRPSTVELHQRILGEAAALARPIVICRAVELAGAGERELTIETGQKLNSKLLARVAGTAEKLLLFAITLGPALDDRENEYKEAGRMLDAFALNNAGTAYIVKSSILLMDKINECCSKAGLRATFPMGPGHSYWSSLADIQTILQLLGAGQIGVQLTGSNLMLPRKSIAMVAGVGPDLPDYSGKTHCDFCSLQNKCHLNRFGAAGNC